MTDTPCPTCGRMFSTSRGMKAHHALSHGEKLPNNTCKHCGTDFHSPYEKAYCSKACHDEGVSFAGENNPNYKGGKSEATCRLCDAAFTYYPSMKKGLYCPDCVQNGSWQTTPSLSGSENPRWTGGKRTVPCDVCTETVERYPSNIGEVVVCSEECRRQWLSQSFRGEGHPNWNGGSLGNYGTGWNRVRKQALERDEYACKHCGTGKGELGRNPDVHHIVPVRWFVESEDHSRADAHTLDNVISLCPSCHRKADFGHISREKLRSLQGSV
ncbi:HNH endonuclease [Haladaptatus sp. ZSTT2]|uniref:HNH endonuclease n=1 Tax=Haladaptatus sp. ZSTT2 TaxID=3120515 RepID=UPI00300EBC53